MISCSTFSAKQSIEIDRDSSQFSRHYLDRVMGNFHGLMQTISIFHFAKFCFLRYLNFSLLRNQHKIIFYSIDQAIKKEVYKSVLRFHVDYSQLQNVFLWGENCCEKLKNLQEYFIASLCEPHFQSFYENRECIKFNWYCAEKITMAILRIQFEFYFIYFIFLGTVNTSSGIHTGNARLLGGN